MYHLRKFAGKRKIGSRQSSVIDPHIMADKVVIARNRAKEISASLGHKGIDYLNAIQNLVSDIASDIPPRGTAYKLFQQLKEDIQTFQDAQNTFQEQGFVATKTLDLLINHLPDAVLKEAEASGAFDEPQEEFVSASEIDFDRDYPIRTGWSRHQHNHFLRTLKKCI